MCDADSMMIKCQALSSCEAVLTFLVKSTKATETEAYFDLAVIFRVYLKQGGLIVNMLQYGRCTE